jgi:hypothetical protein
MAETPEIPSTLGAPGRRGGRQRRGRLVETTVVLDREDIQALDAVAAEAGRSRSELIREAIRNTWLKGGRPTEPTGDAPAAPEGTASRTPEPRAAWRARFGSLLAELQKSAVTDMTEEELAAFVSDEIHAHRREKREARERHAGDR